MVKQNTEKSSEVQLNYFKIIVFYNCVCHGNNATVLLPVFCGNMSRDLPTTSHIGIMPIARTCHSWREKPKSELSQACTQLS